MKRVLADPGVAQGMPGGGQAGAAHVEAAVELDEAVGLLQDRGEFPGQFRQDFAVVNGRAIEGGVFDFHGSATSPF